MTLGLNRKGKNENTPIGLPVAVDRYGQTIPFEFIDSNSSPAVAVNCDNRKAIGKEKCHRTRFEKSTKNDNLKFSKKKITKWKPNFKSINSQNLNSCNGKNRKVNTINFIMVTVITEIIVKMIVMLMNNNNNNKQQYF